MSPVRINMKILHRYQVALSLSLPTTALNRPTYQIICLSHLLLCLAKVPAFRAPWAPIFSRRVCRVVSNLPLESNSLHYCRYKSASLRNTKTMDQYQKVLEFGQMRIRPVNKGERVSSPNISRSYGKSPVSAGLWELVQNLWDGFREFPRRYGVEVLEFGVHTRALHASAIRPFT